MDENLRKTAEFPEGGETAVPKAAEPEADEPKTKSIRFAPSAYDPRGIEQWLSERAAEGKLLLRGDDFVIGAPCECRYHLEPAADDDDPDEHLREKRLRFGGTSRKIAEWGAAVLTAAPCFCKIRRKCDELLCRKSENHASREHR